MNTVHLCYIYVTLNVLNYFGFQLMCLHSVVNYLVQINLSQSSVIMTHYRSWYRRDLKIICGTKIRLNRIAGPRGHLEELGPLEGW